LISLIVQERKMIMNIQYIAKSLITLGVIITVLGVVLYFGGNLGIGRLPGDIYIKRQVF
jgi:multisubunit Na+/H+ antiporter MnhG subunit